MTYANAGSVADVELAVKNDAEGIGLFRSEFLFLGREDYPTEQEQYDVYCRILELMRDRPDDGHRRGQEDRIFSA